MRQTPAHEIHNNEVLQLIPESSTKIIEVGCSTGALAREFKKINSSAYWIGIEIDSDYAKMAQRHCDETMVLDIDSAKKDFYIEHSDVDCWVFGDVLEHLKNPWDVLRMIREVIPPHGCIVACIPNGQNWTILSKLATGDFVYEDSGLLDRTHLRWFTRKTIFELFRSQGFVVTNGISRTFQEPNLQILDLIGKIAQVQGKNADESKADSIPLQYVMKANPI